MTEQYPPSGSRPDPYAASPGGPDGTAPISGQPGYTHSGDSMPGAGPRPPSYRAGYAQVPTPPPPPEREYPPTSEFPAVNPAPAYDSPGYDNTAYDDYAPPPPPPAPPGYRTPPPPPPRRRSSKPIVLVVLVIALLLCGGLVTAGAKIGRGFRDKVNNATGGDTATQAPTAAPTTKASPTPTDGDDDDSKIGHEITVVYEVTGTGSAEVVYLETRGGKTTHTHVDLPWKVTLKLRTPAVLNVTAVRASTDEGTVTCRERVGGEIVKESTSHKGHFGTVTCNYVALN